MRICILLLFSILCTSTYSQVAFIPSNQLIQNQPIRSTLSIGVTDLNGDYQDDIVFLDRGKNLITAYQQGADRSFRLEYSGRILENPAWALSAGDLDNDGISEIFACGINTFGNVFMETGNGKYAFTQLLYGLTFPQNSNMADINNDGWLDIFVCDERAYNDLYLNDGNGRMIYTDYIDMHTVPPSDNSGNYGSEWVDFDDDRDIDLFITKCKPAITEPDDPLRLNVLFVNDGFNRYTERAQEFGLKNGSQSWTGSFGDLDNDGDLDCFVSNHDTTHVIYRNNDNQYFEDVSSQVMTPVRSSSIQAAIRDFDNNGYLDILVSGDRDYLFWNHGNDTWEVETGIFGEQYMFTFATGDLNDDGFLDIVASYGLLNEPGNYDDVIWLNPGNENHFLKFSFLGEQSNRKGVGTKIKVFSPLGIQTRDVKIGESYGTTNSGNLHVGLGAVEQIDSVIIYWPSGTIDRYYGIDADQHVLAHEGICLSPFFTLMASDDLILCPGESVMVSAPETFVQYDWSSGENTPDIQINQAASLQLKAVDATGCARYSKILAVDYDPDETPEIEFLSGGTINCEGTRIELGVGPAQAYHWSTGQETQDILIETAGDYSVTITGHCRDFASEPVSVDFFDVEAPVPTFDTLVLYEPAEVTLEAAGENLYWFPDPFSLEVLDTGLFTTGLLNTDTVFYVADWKEHLAETAQVGKTEHEGTPLGGTNLNSGLMFNAWDSFYLESVKLIADIAGKRTIELRQFDPLDGSTELITKRDVDLDAGTQRIDLNWFIPPGLEYIITTNPDTNLYYLGYKSPGLYRANEGIAYPYSMEGLMEIHTSLHGTSYYYYFFDWTIRPKSISCFSERIPVVILQDTVTSGIAFSEERIDLQLTPNPASTKLHILAEMPISPELYGIVVDIFGNRVIKEWPLKAEILDISHLEDGIYYLHIVDREGYSRQWMIFSKVE